MLLFSSPLLAKCATRYDPEPYINNGDLGRKYSVSPKNMALGNVSRNYITLQEENVLGSHICCS